MGGLYHRRHRHLHRHRDHLQHRHCHATAAHSGASGTSSAYGDDVDDNDSDDLQVGYDRGSADSEEWVATRCDRPQWVHTGSSDKYVCLFILFCFVFSFHLVLLSPKNPVFIV